MNFVTYRLGQNNHFPSEKNGSEVSEQTSLGYTDFMKKTEEAIGPISILWMGSMEMPETPLMEIFG